MSDPFKAPGWAWNRYMLSFAVAGATTLFALLPPLAALAGWVGPGPVAAGFYAMLGLAVVAELLRNGASHLKAPGGRRACLELLQALLWSLVVLAIPDLVLDVAWLSGHASLAGPAEERHVFAVIALVFAIMAAVAAINLAILLRSSFWAAFRSFALESASGAAPESRRT